MRFAPAVLLLLACAPPAPPSDVAPASVSAREAGAAIGQTVMVTGLVWLQDAKWPAMTLTDPAALELLP